MNREKLHRAIRTGDFEVVKQLVESSDGINLAKAKNYYGLYLQWTPKTVLKPTFFVNRFDYFIGRTALHIAVLKERDEIVQYLATRIKLTLHIGDNVILNSHWHECPFLLITFFFCFCFYDPTARTNCITLCNGRKFGWDAKPNPHQEWRKACAQRSERTSTELLFYE